MMRIVVDEAFYHSARYSYTNERAAADNYSAFELVGRSFGVGKLLVAT
jgi:hypothetical protein